MTSKETSTKCLFYSAANNPFLTKTVNTVIEFWRQNKFFQINTPNSFLFEKLPSFFTFSPWFPSNQNSMWQKRKLQVITEKNALNQRVLYKILHLTISSLVVISNKRQGQENVCYKLETRATFADKVMLKCCYQLCACASANSKFKDESCGASISFLLLGLVVFMIECDKVGFFHFLSFNRLRAKKQIS